MFTKNKFGQLVRLSILSATVLASASTSAADLACVIRVINWNNGGNASTRNYVNFSVVALHSNGIAAYATGSLTNQECSAAPWGPGTATCLHSDPVDALLSNRVGNTAGYSQPFYVREPLSLFQIQSIPKDSLGQMSMRRPNAEYKFHPECVGDLLTGNDQWGNHWTMSFQLSSGPIVR